MSATTGATLDASVVMQPKATQIVLVTLLLLCGVSLILSCLFLWYIHPLAWLPWSFTIALAVMASVGWWRSQAAHELAGAAKTVVKVPGIEVHTDALTLNSERAGEALAKLMKTLTHRQPLPAPDGLVNWEMKPIPGSESDARERVAVANKQAEVLKACAVEFIQGSPQFPTPEAQEIAHPVSQPLQPLKMSGASFNPLSS